MNCGCTSILCSSTVYGSINSKLLVAVVVLVHVVVGSGAVDVLDAVHSFPPLFLSRLATHQFTLRAGYVLL